jgi:hypothetical protein
LLSGPQNPILPDMTDKVSTHTKQKANYVLMLRFLYKYREGKKQTPWS